MPSRFNRAAALVVLLTAGSAAVMAQPPRDSSRGAKSVLPDPALLDGSKFQPEKRSEYGMLGEFDIAGDPKSKSDRVGGGGNSEQNDRPTGPQIQVQIGIPSAGSEGQMGAAGLQIPGASGGGTQPNEQNGAQGRAEGQQVAQMKGNAQGGQAGPSGAKPQQIAIGDTAMQIKPQSNAAGAVGTQQQPVGKEVPQQYDKNTPGGNQSVGRGNQGVERGRVMPAGI